MTKITPVAPSFIFGYWRPWKEDSKLFDSYLNYAKDVTLAKYSADTVGKYINEASKTQVKAINDLGQKIGIGMDILSSQLSDIHTELSFLNRNLDLQLEQQKLSNLLLENIGELLRVPDIEKERQHSIELGLKFFTNAEKDEDLFADALEELLKAEELMKQDYFVLHRIGLIYMYSLKHINPQKALDYFTRSAKYASLESNPKATILARVMAKKTKDDNVAETIDKINVHSFVADSYEKAAFAAYVLGDFELSVANQTKAIKHNYNADYLFLLSKYQARLKQTNACIENLNNSIDEKPSILLAVFADLDLIDLPEVLDLIEKKNNNIDNQILTSIGTWGSFNSEYAKKVISELTKLLKTTYDNKIHKLEDFQKLKSKHEIEIAELESNIHNLYSEIKNSDSPLINESIIHNLLEELNNCSFKSFEIKKETYEKNRRQFESKKLKIGSIYEGGIVAYIDETGQHGLVVANKDLGKAIWGDQTIFLRTKTGYGEGKKNTMLIVEKASSQKISWLGLTRKPIQTAARICAELTLNGYNDWFLPSKDELELIFDKLGNEQLIGLFDSSGQPIYNFLFHEYVNWSSSEKNEKHAFYLGSYKANRETKCDCDFKNIFEGGTLYNGKVSNNSVIAVRAF